MDIPVSEAAEATKVTTCDVQDMREVFAIVLKERIHGKTPVEEFKRVEIVETDRGGRPLGVEALYELRHSQHPFSQEGVVGHASRRRFEGLVHFTLDHALAQLRQEQPGCQWEIVAAVVDQVNLRAVRPVAYEGPNIGERSVQNSLATHKEDDTVTQYALNRKTEYVSVPDYRWTIRVCWADVVRGTLIDPQVALGGHPGPLTKYAETRQLRHLTQSMRNMRVKCEALIDEYMERTRSTYARDISHVATAAERLTPAMRDTAVKLRNQGVNVHDIAQLLSLPVDDVTEILDAVIGGIPAVTDHEALGAHVDSVLADGGPAVPSRTRGRR